MGPFGGERRRWKALEPKRERDKHGPDPAMFALLRALVILMFGILALQLINLQVIKGDEYKHRAEINALREVPLSPARGLIYDRAGRPLVQNSARFTATVDLPTPPLPEIIPIILVIFLSAFFHLNWAFL